MVPKTQIHTQGSFIVFSGTRAHRYTYTAPPGLGRLVIRVVSKTASTASLQLCRALVDVEQGDDLCFNGKVRGCGGGTSGPGVTGLRGWPSRVPRHACGPSLANL